MYSSDVIGLKVTKSDTERPTDPVEDLLVEIGERKILVEVKGTKATNPPLDYPQQAITHIRRRGYGGEVEAGLIVNHDMQKDPSNANSHTVQLRLKESLQMSIT